MNKQKNLYNKDSIESLSPLQFTRLRPGVYACYCTYSTQLLVEIISNAVDEFRLGHGNKIKVIIQGDVIEVHDYGQGFLVNEVREDGTTILVGYGKKDKAIWWIKIADCGSAPCNLIDCEDEEAEIYSDVFEIEAEAVAWNLVEANK